MSVAKVNRLCSAISLPRSQVSDLSSSSGNLRAFLINALMTVSVSLPVTLYQHCIACIALDKGRNLAVLASERLVAFPVTGYRPVFNAGRTLADRDGVGDSAVMVRLHGVMARTAHHSGAPQMRHQFLLQGAAGLDEEAAIDGLVRHVTAHIVWIGALEPTGNLLRCAKARFSASLPTLGRRPRSQANWSA